MTSISLGHASLLGLFLRRHALLIGLLLCYSVLAFALAQHFGTSMHERKIAGLLQAFLTQVPMMLALVLCGRLLLLTYVQRVPNRIGVLKGEVFAFFGNRERFRTGKEKPKKGLRIHRGDGPRF